VGDNYRQSGLLVNSANDVYKCRRQWIGNQPKDVDLETAEDRSGPGANSQGKDRKHFFLIQHEIPIPMPGVGSCLLY
jgi:hypothetical protein